MSRTAVEKHPRATRWMHWINFPVIFIMIYSGFRIYWSNDVYRLGYGSTSLFDFWPDGFNEALQLDRKLAQGMAFHFTFGWFFALNGVAYVAYLLKSGEWRHVVPDRRALKDSVAVVAHDLHLRKTLPPQGRYNAAQQLTYGTVILMGAIALFTGLAIYKPTQLAPLLWIFGGYETARAIHFVVTISFLVFFLIHILQVARAGFPNFWSMVTGYELQKDDGAAPSDDLTAPATPDSAEIADTDGTTNAPKNSGDAETSSEDADQQDELETIR